MSRTAVRTRLVVTVATGEASRAEGATAGAVVTTAAVVAMTPEAVDAAVAAEADTTTYLLE